MRGRSYTPSPPRGHGYRGRSPRPRGRSYGGDRSRYLPTSLLVRNLRHDFRPEDIRRPFERFGPVKDIYLPKDYYTGQVLAFFLLTGDCAGNIIGKGYWEPRGFGFVQYVEPADATEAKYQMDGYVLLGRELTVVFADENRKKPTEMRHRERGGGRGGGSRYHDRRKLRQSRSHSPREVGRPIRRQSPSPMRRVSKSPSDDENKRELNGERSPSQ